MEPLLEKNKNHAIRMYLRNITGGLISLKDAHIDHIRKMITEEHKEKQVLVKHSKYDSQSKLYKHFRSFMIDEEFAKQQIEKHKTALKYTGFYKFEISELGFSIETVNDRIFEK